MALRGGTSFVGRVQELKILRAGLDCAFDGQGGVVLLAGEPGIGKTSLAVEFARRAQLAGAEVLVGRCYEGEGAPAFWPWTQLLRAYVAARDAGTLAAELGASAPDVATVCPELIDRLGEAVRPVGSDPKLDRFRLFDGVTRTLSRAALVRPIVLQLDDLHGADEPSLLLLQFLARALPGSRVFVVGGLRDLALEREDSLAETLAELVREQVVELVRLSGLCEEEIGELLAQVIGEVPPVGLAAAVEKRTEGNPLYATEVARTLAAGGSLAMAAARERLDLPVSVRLTIGKRLRGLSTPCQGLLASASLFGREFGIETLARASGMSLEEVLVLLDEADRAHITEATPGDTSRRRFVHALFGETIGDALGAAARASTHRRLAEALAVDPRAREYAAEIAHHWLEAGPSGDSEQAAYWSSAAAERALGLLAYEEAARLFRNALKAIDASAAPGDLRRAEVMLGLGEAWKRAGKLDDAKRVFLEAAAIGRKLESPELMTRAALGYAPSVTYAEQPAPDAVLMNLLESANTAWDGRDSGLHAHSLARLALAQLFFVERATALAETALSMARRVGDPTTLRQVLECWLATHPRVESTKPRLAIATELLKLAVEAGDREALAVGRLWRTVHLLELGDADGMRREQTEFALVADALRQPAWTWYARITETARALLDGRFEHAEQTMVAALRDAEATLPFASRAYSVGMMAILRTWQGRAGEYAEDYRAIFGGHPSVAAMSPLAFIESERGNAAEARRVVERITAGDFEAVRSDIIWLVTVCFLGEACVNLSDAPRAKRLYDLLPRDDSRWVLWAVCVPLGPVALYLGLLARALGRLDEAVNHLDRALAETARAASPPFLARSQYECAVVLRKRDGPGDAERAATLVCEARTLADKIGMAGLVAKIDALGNTPSSRSSVAQSFQTFRRVGDFWTISYAGSEIRLRDARGLHYLAMLLLEPGREFHATDLVLDGRRPASVRATDPTLTVSNSTGDVGPRIDKRAIAAYHARLNELDDRIAEASRLNDLGWLERAGIERDALLEELGASARGKRASSDAERARVAATKGLGFAIDRIEASHPELGSHLRATVRRGYFCSYVPDPRIPIEWGS